MARSDFAAKRGLTPPETDFTWLAGMVFRLRRQYRRYRHRLQFEQHRACLRMALPPRWYMLKLPRMSYRHLRQSRISKAVLFWLVPALLLSLGLRVCLHTPHTADEVHAHATAIHLESNITSPLDSSDDNANDSHVSLAFVLFKFGKLVDSLVVAAVLTAALLLFLPRQTARVPASAGVAVPSLPGGHRLRPPLRAPPR